MELTKEEKLDICNKVLIEYIKLINESIYMCHCLKYKIKDKGYDCLTSKEVPNFIPEVLLVKPKTNYAKTHSDWWNSSKSEPRIRALNKLIKIIEDGTN